MKVGCKMKIKKKTIVMGIVLILSFVNLVLEAMGKPVIPINEDSIRLFIDLGFSGIASVLGYWFDQDLTLKARERKAEIEG